MIQAHILKKAKAWIERIKTCYLGDITFAEYPRHFSGKVGVGLEVDGVWFSDEYGIIYDWDGFGMNATEYTIIHIESRKIISRHRMFIHAQKKCASLNNDSSRYFQARRKIALLPSGGLLRQENCPRNYYPSPRW